MEYNAREQAFYCDRCNPRPWKYIHTQVLFDGETGDAYCIVHRQYYEKIGNESMIVPRRTYEEDEGS